MRRRSMDNECGDIEVEGGGVVIILWPVPRLYSDCPFPDRARILFGSRQRKHTGLTSRGYLKQSTHL